MKTNYITINGTTYIESKKALEAYHAPIAATDIDDAYSRPSYRKRCIWKEWAEALTGAIWIKGFTSQHFTIAGVTVDETTRKEYAVFITPFHDYAYEL